MNHQSTLSNLLLSFNVFICLRESKNNSIIPFVKIRGVEGGQIAKHYDVESTKICMELLSFVWILNPISLFWFLQEKLKKILGTRKFRNLKEKYNFQVRDRG